jgi:hypothetical protein
VLGESPETAGLRDKQAAAACGMPLLLGCVAIDCTDIVSALLSGAAGQFDRAETLGLMTTAIAALVPNTKAIAPSRAARATVIPPTGEPFDTR